MKKSIDKIGRKKSVKNMTISEYCIYIGITDQAVIDKLIEMESFKSPSSFNKAGEVHLLVGLEMYEKLRRYWPDCVGYKL